jgi:hypothetical protein
MHIDLNADLGEGCDTDEQLLTLVSSANIACGWHAGDASTMRRSVRWAIQNHVAIGAHPSFPTAKTSAAAPCNCRLKTSSAACSINSVRWTPSCAPKAAA